MAVSGGVDSMVLLHLLAQQNQMTDENRNNSTLYPLPSTLELVVAHFNHGIRPDSDLDEELVTKIARTYGLAAEVGYGRLGKGTSEETARQARYVFLENIRKKNSADAIITAHHQDDLIETAFINLIRGTGRQGLSSIRSKNIFRPLLNTAKAEILAYAKENNMVWHEDSTNLDEEYLRNYIRRKVIPKLTIKKRAEIVNNLDKVAKINGIIDNEIATLSHNKHEIDRQTFISLPTAVGCELLTFWLRQNDLRDFDRKTIYRISVAIKTALPGTKHEVIKGKTINISKKKAILR